MEVKFTVIATHALKGTWTGDGSAWITFPTFEEALEAAKRWTIERSKNYYVCQIIATSTFVQPAPVADVELHVSGDLKE